MALILIPYLLESVNNGELQYLRNTVLIAGLFYITKIGLKMLYNLFNGLKIFILPSVWPRNFTQEYGELAVVTGCSKGIGLGYAEELAKMGMNLVLIARKAELLNNIAVDIHAKYGVKVEVIIADFGKDDTIYKDIENQLINKDIGILVNNVGVASDGLNYFHKASEEKMWNMINVNIVSVTMMMKMILPKMEAKRKGAIINVASVASFGPSPFLSQYSATKVYIDYLSRGAAYEYSDKGITVQCICPGPVGTDMITEILKGDEKQMAMLGLIPDVKTYTESALKTLGFAFHTTGYWRHALLYYTGFYTSPGFTSWTHKIRDKKNSLEKEKSA